MEINRSRIKKARDKLKEALEELDRALEETEPRPPLEPPPRATKVYKSRRRTMRRISE
jgi:hypothetical protein